MKYAALLWTLLALLLGGCVYESPLTEEHNIAIDPSVLGMWEKIPEKGDEAERMLILKYSDTEYMIQYPIGKGGKFWRAYPIKIGGVPCVQVQVIGNSDGSPLNKKEPLFHVVSYQQSGTRLVFKELNVTAVDNKELKTTAELVQEFVAHKNDKDLFDSPRTFKKIGS